MKTIFLSLMAMFFFHACSYQGSKTLSTQDSLNASSSATYLQVDKLKHIQEGQLYTLPQGSIQQYNGTIQTDGLLVNGHKYFLLIDSVVGKQSIPIPQISTDPNLEFNMPNKILQDVIVKPSS